MSLLITALFAVCLSRADLRGAVVVPFVLSLVCLVMRPALFVHDMTLRRGAR